jgi:hypothetical protein
MASLAKDDPAATCQLDTVLPVYKHFLKNSDGQEIPPCSPLNCNLSQLNPFNTYHKIYIGIPSKSMTLYSEVSGNLKGRNHVSARDPDGKILLK